MTLTPEQIEAIRKRAEAATPGPWRVAYKDKAGQSVICDENIERFTGWHHSVGAIEKEMEHNADFIAHARTDIPTLLSALAAEREHTKINEQVASTAMNAMRAAERNYAVANGMLAAEKKRADEAVSAYKRQVFNAANVFNAAQSELTTLRARVAELENVLVSVRATIEDRRNGRLGWVWQRTLDTIDATLKKEPTNDAAT